MRCGKIMFSLAGHSWQFGACTLHAGYLCLQTHIQYYAILLAVPLQQWFHIDTSILHYIHYLSLTPFTETNFCAQKLILINSIIKYDAQQVQQIWRWLVFFVATACITITCFVIVFKFVIPLSHNCGWIYFLAESSCCTHLIFLQVST